MLINMGGENKDTHAKKKNYKKQKATVYKSGVAFKQLRGMLKL